MPITSSPPAVTPVGFDHTAYPHLLDRILGFADTPGLLVFRGTSRSYQARLDAMLFKHIILDDGDRDASLLQADIVDLDMVMTEMTRLVIRVPAPQGRMVIPWADMGSEARASASRALAHTRVVDYHCYCDVDADPVLAAALHGVEVARRVFPCPEVIVAHTVVDYLDVSNAGYWTAKPAVNGEAPAPCAFHIPAGVKRSVLNVLYPNRVGDWSQFFNCEYRAGTEFVVKFAPRDTSPSRSRLKMLQDSELVADLALHFGAWGFGMLGPLFKALGTVMEESNQVCTVGMTEIPKRLVGLSDDLPAEPHLSTLKSGIAMFKGAPAPWVFPDPNTLLQNIPLVGNASYISTNDYLEDTNAAKVELEAVPVTHGGDVGRLFVPAAAAGAWPEDPPECEGSMALRQDYAIATDRVLAAYEDRLRRVGRHPPV